VIRPNICVVFSPNLTRRANHRHTGTIAKISKPAPATAAGFSIWRALSFGEGLRFLRQAGRRWMTAYLISLALAFLIAIAVLDATL
jgi:hypothetical protein